MLLCGVRERGRCVGGGWLNAHTHARMHARRESGTLGEVCRGVCARARLIKAVERHRERRACKTQDFLQTVPFQAIKCAAAVANCVCFSCVC